MFTTVTPAAHELSIAEERRQPAERGAVAHARRHRDHRRGHQPAHHARERSFHSRDDDDHARLPQHVGRREQPVDAGDADVHQSLDPRSERLGHHGGFLGHGQVAGAGGDDQDGSARGRDAPGAAR